MKQPVVPQGMSNENMNEAMNFNPEISTTQGLPDQGYNLKNIV